MGNIVPRRPGVDYSSGRQPYVNLHKERADSAEQAHMTTRHKLIILKRELKLSSYINVTLCIAVAVLLLLRR